MLCLTPGSGLSPVWLLEPCPVHSTWSHMRGAEPAALLQAHTSHPQDITSTCTPTISRTVQHSPSACPAPLPAFWASHPPEGPCSLVAPNLSELHMHPTQAWGGEKQVLTIVGSPAHCDPWSRSPTLTLVLQLALRTCCSHRHRTMTEITQRDSWEKI